MGLHLCPIEPPDWSDGPDGGDEDCELCGGSGVYMTPTGDKETPFIPVPCDCAMERLRSHNYDRREDDVI